MTALRSKRSLAVRRRLGLGGTVTFDVVLTHPSSGIAEEEDQSASTHDRHPLLHPQVMESGDLWLAIVVAAATAIGGGVGGAVAALTTVRVEAKRAEREAASEGRLQLRLAERDAAEIRRVCRLLAGELSTAKALVQQARDEGDHLQIRGLRLNVWRANQERFADLPNREHWTLVSAVFSTLEILEHDDGRLRPKDFQSDLVS